MSWGAHRSNCLLNPKGKEKYLKVAKKSNTKERNKYTFYCKKCKKKYELTLTKRNFETKQYRKHCSRKCANSRSQTEETKNKIRKKLAGHIYENGIRYKKHEDIILICQNCGGIKKVTYGNRKMKFCSINCACSYLNHTRMTVKTKSKLSRATSRSYKNGRKIYGGRTKWIEIETSIGKIKVQGSYEVRTCRILDQWKEIGKIKNWEYTQDRFEYIGYDRKNHYYLLDFKIFTDGGFYYLEPKGWIRTNDLLKWNAIRKLNYKLIVWFKKDIKREEKLLKQSSNQIGSI